jgi:hypothetical protein
MCFEYFRDPCAWEEPAADHLNAEQIGTVGPATGIEMAPKHAGRHRRALAYAAEYSFEVDGYASGLRRFEPFLDSVDDRLIAADLPQS